MKTEVVVGGVVAMIVVVGLIYLIKNFNGAAIGSQAAGLVTGAVGGVATTVAAAANNPDVNPLYNVGSALGSSIFDLFNSTPNLNSAKAP
jgi:hypothetical protein